MPSWQFMCHAGESVSAKLARLLEVVMLSWLSSWSLLEGLVTRLRSKSVYIAFSNTCIIRIFIFFTLINNDSCRATFHNVQFNTLRSIMAFSNNSVSSQSSTSSQYYISKCIVRGSVILQVLYGHFRFPSSKHIVFGKQTSIELLAIDEDGNLESVSDQPVFGTIKDLAVLACNDKFRPNDPQMCGKDLLVALSDSGKLSLLTFCNQMNRFFPITHVQLPNPHFGILAVESSGCFIAARPPLGHLALFSVSMTGGDIIDKKILYHPSDTIWTESTSRNMQKSSIYDNILSMCFISLNSGQPSEEHNPVLAIILRRMGELLNELLLLKWNVKSQRIIVISQFVEDGPRAYNNIVEVPNSHGLAFLFRAGDVLLMNFRDPYNPLCVYRTSLNCFPIAMEEKTYVEDSCIRRIRKDTELNEKDNESGNTKKYICSWSWEPDNNEVPRMIFCADTGDFFMIEVSFDSGVPKVKQSECLYKGLPCKDLLWVKGGYLAAVVKMRDGMVLKLKDGRLCFTRPILNISPISDVAHDEKHDHIFAACCGVAPEGSLRIIIQSGISVKKLCRIGFINEVVVGIWAVRMKVTDLHHSFIVLSFLAETRILSVRSRFDDYVTSFVGFQPNVCTLACGLVRDGLLVQIYQTAVKLCLPTNAAHSEGIPLSSPNCTFWSPDNVNIILGAVGHNFIVVSTSNPCSLFILGIKYLSVYEFEIFEMKHLGLENEISCISIPRQKIGKQQSNPSISENNSFVIGTHKPSVEVWSFAPDGEVIVVACATISLTGASNRFCIPQDVRLVFVGKYYVLAGLKNGMLLRFEWPSESFPSSPISVVDSATKAIDKRHDLPSVLQLIAIRCIGNTPVKLVPLDDTVDADIIALSDKPWLLHTARQELSYTSIKVQSSSHLTPVCTIEYPKGIIYVGENSLHLVDMVHNERLNKQKFRLEGTPRKVLYHDESQMLFVMRNELNHGTYSSDICCVDPLSGSVLSSFEIEHGEAKSMALVKFGSDLVLVVGIISYGPDVQPNGEAKCVRGRLLVLRLDNVQNSADGFKTFCKLAVHYHKKLSSSEMWQFRMIYKTTLKGIPLLICPYLDKYFLISTGEATCFMIKSLTAHCSRIAVAADHYGILFFSYDEDEEKLTHLTSEPSEESVKDCILMDDNTAFVLDLDGSIAVVSSAHLKAATSRTSDLSIMCAYFIGEKVMSIRKYSFSYRLPADDAMLGEVASKTNAIVASTYLGSIIIFLPLSREEYELLEAAQEKLAVHHLTAPILGNNHNKFRSHGKLVRVPNILDGDMLTQLLDLTCMDQDTILQSQMVEQVVQILEGVRYAVNTNTVFLSPLF